MKELTIEITNRCSQKCMHCSSEAGPDGDVLMSLEDVTGYLEKYKDFDVVRLSGGEPFEHPELLEILKKIKVRGKRATVLSCGVAGGRPLSKRLVEACAKYTDEIVFSMHGWYDTHDKIVTGKDGFDVNELPYWGIAWHSIDTARQNKIQYSIEAVVVKQNFDYLDDIAFIVKLHNGLTKYCDVSLHLLRFVKQGRGLQNADLLALEDWQTERVPAMAKELSDEYEITVTCTGSFDHRRCDCGDRKAAITWSGEEIPCSALKNFNGAGEGKYLCERLDRV